METFSEDGSINVYTVRDGMYVRTIFPATFGSAVYKLDHVDLSYQGHVIMAGHSQDVHSLHVYTVNGHLLTSRCVCPGAQVVILTVQGQGPNSIAFFAPQSTPESTPERTAETNGHLLDLPGQGFMVCQINSL